MAMVKHLHLDAGTLTTDGRMCSQVLRYGEIMTSRQKEATPTNVDMLDVFLQLHEGC